MIQIERPKSVEWDQERLRVLLETAIVAKAQATPYDAELLDLAKTKATVHERDYAKATPATRALLDRLRTVKTSKPRIHFLDDDAPDVAPITPPNPNAFSPATPAPASNDAAQLETAA